VPTSPVIREIRWAPKDTIIRQARGSDYWPITWADWKSTFKAVDHDPAAMPALLLS
jgi:hypothetical protein